MFRVYDYLGLFLDNLERQFDWKLARSMAIFRIFIFGRSFFLKLYGYFLTNQKFFSTFSWLLMTPDLSFTYPLLFQVFRSVIPCLTNSQTFFQVWGPLVFFVSFFLDGFSWWLSTNYTVWTYLIGCASDVMVWPKFT